MSRIAYRQGFTGLGAELSAIPIAQISNGDSAMVVDTAKFYFYQFNSAATNATSAPTYIRPNDFVTSGVWILAASPYEDGMGIIPSGTVMEGSIVGLDTYSDASINTFYCTRGKAKDSTNTSVGHLDATIRKLVNTAWSAGDNNGILLNGNIAAGTMAHVYALIRDSDALIDIGALLYTDDISLHLPSGYSKYRYLDSYYTTAAGSGNDISSFKTVSGLHYNLIGSDTYCGAAITRTTYASHAISGRVPAVYYVGEVLYGVRHNSSNDEFLFISAGGTYPYTQLYADKSATDTYLPFNRAVDGSQLFIPNTAVYTKVHSGYSTYLLCQAFKIRR